MGADIHGRRLCQGRLECQHVLQVVGFVDYMDRFGQHHRSGYGRVYYPQADDRHSSEYRIDTDGINDSEYQDRNNLHVVTQPGYNYDRPTRPGECDDWPTRENTV